MKTASTEEIIQALIRNLSELEGLGKTIVSGQGNFSTLSHVYLRIVLEALQVSKGAILRFNSSESQLVIESSVNINDESLVIPITPHEIVMMLQSSILDLCPPYLPLKRFLNQIQPQLQVLDANLWLPLKIHEEFLGVISLGLSSTAIEMKEWTPELLSMLADHIQSRWLTHVHRRRCALPDFASSRFPTRQPRSPNYWIRRGWRKKW